MLKKAFLLFALVLFLLASCMTKMEYKPVLNINTFDALKQYFQSPPVQYQTAPFWVWHDRVSKEEIDLQLQDFKTKGIGGVFIHPRYGLITEYLSDEWFELVKFAVDRCKELGMQAWLYDENSFPSGFAGGHVAAEMPESYNQGSGLVLHRLTELPQDRNQYLVILKKSGETFKEVTTSDEGVGEFYAFEKKDYDSNSRKEIL